MLLAIAGVGLWTWFSLSWAYSDGTRAGVLQKFSRRGWICKTEEGELAQYVVAGVSPQIWQFSVRDRKLGAQLEKLVGERVQLHYTEHSGVPTSCFADTRYFVDRVAVIADAAPAAAPIPAPAPAPAPAPGPSTAPPVSPAPPSATPPNP
ncbi:MAG TPA: hypothetical protein VN754_08590 [Candidatus Binataceae bacterium]|nr:hypothetical protein [Candidatus Binataceae bacterium]